MTRHNRSRVFVLWVIMAMFVLCNVILLQQTGPGSLQSPERTMLWCLMIVVVVTSITFPIGLWRDDKKEAREREERCREIDDALEEP